MTATRLGFGRYRGQPVTEIPSDYLRWLLQEVDLISETRAAITRELERRRGEPWAAGFERDTLADLQTAARPHGVR